MRLNRKTRYLRGYVKCYFDSMVNYNDLFYLGYLYYCMGNQMKNRKVKPASESWTAIGVLTTFQERLQRLGIHDRTLDRFLTETIAKLTRYKKEQTTITAEDAEKIQQTMSGMWEHFVNDLLRERKLILEIDNTTINPKKLRRGVGAFFDKGDIEKIPDGIQWDLRDGMTNMLLGLWTPSVMLNLRAIEGVLRKFYKKKTGKNAVPRIGKFMNWGKILKDLRGKKIKRELMVDLGYLNSKRNEAQHPDRRFSQPEAETIFNRTLYVITGMLAEL